MSETRSSVLSLLQQPQFWVPCSAALLTLVFLGKWVLQPELPETADQPGIANDQAQQDLTAEASALGSEIDNLEVLLNELDFQPSVDQNLEPLPSAGTPLDLSSLFLTDTTSGVGSTSAPAALNSSALNPSALDPLAAANPESSLLKRSTPDSTPNLVSRTEAGTLQLSLPEASTQPLFGTPQVLGLPQSNLQSTSPTILAAPPQPNRPGTIASPPFSSNPALPYPYNTPEHTSRPTSGESPNTAQNPATLNPVPFSHRTFIPVNPYHFSPYGASGVNATGNPNLSGNRGLPATNPNGLVSSPYSLDSSFSDPLTPPLGVTPPAGRTLAPGQDIGNGEINTFANP